MALGPSAERLKEIVETEKRAQESLALSWPDPIYEDLASCRGDMILLGNPKKESNQ